VPHQVISTYPAIKSGTIDSPISISHLSDRIYCAISVDKSHLICYHLQV